jgi:hypothetical protein
MEPLMLAVGQSVMVPVAARKSSNDTGLQVAAGQHYEFQTAGSWVDMWVTSDAGGYPTPWWSLGQRLGERFRRVPDAPWFALIGMVRAGTQSQLFIIGAASQVIMPMSGRLACFANDVPGFYWNNRGTVQLTIRRSG